MNIQQPVKSIPDAKSDESLKREIWLDVFRAATWIVYIEELMATGEVSSAVKRFYEELSDACWLARWKRENVVIEVEICEMPELVSQLIPSDTQAVTTSYLEDILATLTANQFTNHAR
jgi:hypothetical protein